MMKKLMTLLIAAGLVFSAVNGASAVEVKASGMFDIVVESTGGINGPASFMSSKDFVRNFNQDFTTKHFGAVQRLRMNLDFIASENLSAHYGVQVGTFTWGGPASGVEPSESNGGALGTRSNNITTREAYIDWIVPSTYVKVRMGLQSYLFPGYAINSPVLDDTATGITVMAPFTDNMSATAFWIRALSSARRGDGGMADGISDRHDNYDLFGLNLNMRYDGFEVTPWGAVGVLGSSAYGVIGGESVAFGSLPATGYYRMLRSNGTYTANLLPSNSTVWFAGLSGEVTRWDPLRLALDFYYSGSDNKYRSTERSGWYIAGAAEYKTEYGVPTLKGWYASGDDGKLNNGSERPLTLSGGFAPGASIYFQGRYGIGNTINNGDAGGTWGISAQWNNAMFWENLHHSLRVTYFQGTNNSKMPSLINNGPTPYGVLPATYLTTKDHVIEVDFDTTYSIYKNLATVLELGYAFQNFDKNVWRTVDDRKADFSNAWRAALNFRYTF